MMGISSEMPFLFFFFIKRRVRIFTVDENKRSSTFAGDLLFVK